MHNVIRNIAEANEKVMAMRSLSPWLKSENNRAFV
jgi:hypothetical protein